MGCFYKAHNTLIVPRHICVSKYIFVRTFLFLSLLEKISYFLQEQRNSNAEDAILRASGYKSCP